MDSYYYSKMDYWEYIHLNHSTNISSNDVSYKWLTDQTSMWPVDCLLFMWGKIMIPMYRLWLHNLYGLYGPRCPQSLERLLTDWGRGMHISIGNVTIIGSDNGLSPGRLQAIILTNAGILSIGPLATNFNENSIGIRTFSFKKMHCKMSSSKWRPFCLGHNVLI